MSDNGEVPTFTTKIAIVIRDDLAIWQKLNVTAFLATGIIGAYPEILGEPYRDSDGNQYHRLAGQPIIVLAANVQAMKTIYERAMQRAAAMAVYVEEMFKTGHDAANRATVRASSPQSMNVVGLALREEKKLVDKITKGATLHP
ncbi:MAG TPA: DUF2000 family protein [Vicinamibacterales bacterium]|nr:DUF2000 family protein [Vicinamibacterales bacterium]